jgi:hypothetical protein
MCRWLMLPASFEKSDGYQEMFVSVSHPETRQEFEYDGNYYCWSGGGQEGPSESWAERAHSSFRQSE